MNQAALAPESPDYLDLVRSVEGVARAHAAASEEGRTLAPEVVRALRASGLFALAAPRPLGGGELDPLAQVEAFEAMARADTSAGWCLMISSLCAAMAGAYLPDRGAAEVFERGVPTCAGLIQPAGVARRVPGGFVVDGRWGFGSGVRHADWIVTSAVVNGPIDDKTGLPEMITIVVPRADVTIEDTWRTAGLKGSGSEHYRVEALSVPQELTFSFPFGAARRGGPLYRFPLLALLTSGHVGFALGAARGALDAVIELAPSRINTWTRLSMASHAGFHKDLGRAETRLAAARAFEEEESSTSRSARPSASRRATSPTLRPRSRPSRSARAGRAPSTTRARSSAVFAICTRRRSTSRRARTPTNTEVGSRSGSPRCTRCSRRARGHERARQRLPAKKSASIPGRR